MRAGQLVCKFEANLLTREQYKEAEKKYIKDSLYSGGEDSQVSSMYDCIYDDTLHTFQALTRQMLSIFGKQEQPYQDITCPWKIHTVFALIMCLSNSASKMNSKSHKF